jgi:hypothetical protein
LNITPTVIEINVNRGSSFAKWGTILGTLSDQTDLQNALNLKANLVGGKVPASELPSYVDDVVEVANYAALPATGETGKIYVTLDNNKIYRWSGSVYIEIAANNTIWGAITGTLSSQTDLQAALDAKQNTITLTTTGTSGSATLVGSTLNIPNYTTDISGLVPYTGATSNVNLGTHKLTAADLVINHASGSGVAASITKGGSGEALTVLKTSGSGNAASILGGVTLLDELHLNTDLADAYIASAATWNAKQAALNGTGFVKISGTTISYDNSTYALDNAVVHLTGAETITGEKSFNNATSSSSIFVTNSSTGNGISSFNTSTGNGLYLQNNSTGKGAYINSTSSGIGLFINNTTGATGLPFVIAKSNSNVLTINDAGEITGNKFIKSGGTSSQFLKADGSVDSSTYALDSAVVKLSGSQTISGVKTFSNMPILSAASGVNGQIVYADASNQLKTITNFKYNDATGVLTTQLGDLGSNAYTSTAYQPLLTNPITGTGTTNYLPKFTGSTALGNSLIFDNGTNVGIGTSSPNSILEISQASPIFRIQASDSATFHGIEFRQGAGFDAFIKQLPSTGEFRISNGRSVGWGGFTSFYTDTVERMRITSGGNVGIGTTSPGVKFVNSGATLAPTPTLGSGSIGANAILSANGLYGLYTGVSNTGDVWQQVQRNDANNAVYNLLLQPSGGNVGIGTTSPTRTLEVVGTMISQKESFSPSEFLIGQFDSAGNAILNNVANGMLAFNTNNTRRMTITSGGNVGIGTTSPAQKLHIGGVGSAIAFDTTGAAGTVLIQTVLDYELSIKNNRGLSTEIVVGNDNLRFATNTAERMRITSGGNVLIGTTTISGNSDGGSTNTGVIIEGPSGTLTSQRNNDANIYLSKASGFSNGTLINFYTSGSQRGSISTNGTTTSYNITSDYRLKEDFKSINGLDLISKIKIYDFKFKNSDLRMDGVIAHELQEVVPYAVSGEKDAEEMQQVDYSKLVPILVQAIQELKAEIEILKTK